MKKFLCITLVLLIMAAAATILVGCGEDKSKSSSAAQATKAPTSAATAATVPTTSLTTLAPAQQNTQPDQDDETADQQEAEPVDPSDAEYYNEYGGISGQQAILKALSYAGQGYQCVSYDKRYLQNQEAWFVGVQAAYGEDETVYYLYVNADQCVPVTDIPAIGGSSDDQPGSYGGITQTKAIAIAIQNQEGEYSCTSSEQVEIDGVEYWRIGLQSDDDGDGQTYYFLVNSYSCFEE